MNGPEGALEPLTPQEASDLIDDILSRVIGDSLPDNFIPVHWILVVGAQESSGEESSVAYVPRHLQPFYVSVGLINYQKARLDGITMNAERYQGE